MNRKQRTNITELTICYSCGSEKSDPFVICDCCHAIPTNEEQVLVSMCSTTLMSDLAQLEKARESISKGSTLKIESASRRILLDILKEGGSDINEIIVNQLKYAQSLSKDKMPP